MEKLNNILEEMDRSDYDRREELKQDFCDEMVCLIERLEAKNSIASKTISEIYKSDIQNGNYTKAIECFEYVEQINI